MIFLTVDQIKAANKRVGHFYFVPGAMRGFRTRVLSGVYGGRYFVVSTQFVDSRGNADPRAYMVCYVDEDGYVDDMGEKFKHLTKYMAKKYARLLGEGVKPEDIE